MRVLVIGAAGFLGGTAVLLGAMGRARVGRLMLASSVAVYGEGRYRGAQSGPLRALPGTPVRGGVRGPS
ncbi:hypothetical protein [Nocardia sp. NPDC004750]